VSIVPPLGDTSYSRFTPDSFIVGEQASIYTGRLLRPEGRVPVIYFHGAGQDPRILQDKEWQPLFNAYARSGHPVVVPELGGTSVWATPALVDNGGLVDDAIDYAALPAAGGVLSSKVIAQGVSMGTLNALAWSWRLPNPGRIRALTLLGPIVNFEKFYNDNASFQAQIDASWGTHGAWLAGLDNSDPWRNLDLIRPYGHRITLFYATQDQFIDPEDVLAFAELVGATAYAVDTEHLQLIANAPVDHIVSHTTGVAVDRAHAYVGWDDVDWDRFDNIAVTIPADPDDRNTNVRDTLVAPGGRRGEFVRLAGTNGNERFAELLREVSAPDLLVQEVWHNGDSGLQVGQHGNIPKGYIDTDAGTYKLYMAWSDIFFGIPWHVNRGVWSGHYDADDLALLGSVGGVIPGLRLSAGGQILASSRAGNIVTLVVDQDDADRAYRSGIIDVAMTGILGNYVGPVTRLDDNHLQYTLNGADVTSGGPGSWADFASCFPFHADTSIQATVMRGRFYPLAMDPPAWDDPDWTFTWTDTGGWGHRGYGHPGQMFGHVGIASPGARAFLQVGPFIADEL
jgi:hypothetical protein